MALDEHVHHFSTDEYSRIVGTGALDGIRVQLLDGLLVDMNRHPETALLVAEVAVSSKQVDLRKAAVYAAAGIPIYWLVDVLARTVLEHTGPGAAGYELVRTLLAVKTLRLV